MKAPQFFSTVILVLTLSLGAGAPSLLAQGGGHGGGGHGGGGGGARGAGGHAAAGGAGAGGAATGGSASASAGSLGGIGGTGGVSGRAGGRGGRGGYGRGSHYGFPGTFTGYGDPYGVHRDAAPRLFRDAAVVGHVSAVDVQRALRERGYYRGRVDGRFDASSGAALERFRRDHGLAAGGYLDPATVGALGLAAR